MSLETDIAEFRQKLRASHERFQREEQMMREQCTREGKPTEALADMLERPTRRFLIDEMLRALDWDPDEPQQVAEEARSWSNSGERLYFDYLGLSRDRAPVLLFEAKGFDVELPRRPREDASSAGQMPEEIAKAINEVRAGKKQTPLIAIWTEILQDMHGYIASLDELGVRTLKRAVIMAGGWVIVFKDPVATFRTADKAEAEHIACFIDFGEQLQEADKLYRMLHRTMLVDTLPLTLKVTEALQMIGGEHIGDCFRGVLVATTTNAGGRRQPFPFRTVYPALVISSGGRWYAIVDYDNNYAAEPKPNDDFEAFLIDLEKRGSKLERSLAHLYGRSFTPLPLSSFPGFGQSARSSDILTSPIEDSTEARRERTETRKSYVTDSGEYDANEYVVVTGTKRFYKADTDGGLECVFHLWKSARNEGVGTSEFRDGYLVNSFTVDGQDRHCAHGYLIAMRSDRCQLRALESHLCCQACIFRDECWNTETDRKRLPCRSTPVDGFKVPSETAVPAGSSTTAPGQAAAH